MRELDVWPTFERGASFGAKYKSINQRLHELKSKLGVDLWTLDSLFSQFVRLDEEEFSDIDESTMTRETGEEFPQISELEIGEIYYRNDLHDKYGGNYNSGISPSGDQPYVFIFTGDAGDRFGYEDGFEDGTFVYTGEGQEDDMDMSGYNRAVRDHQDENRELHLFKSVDEPWGIVYLGQFKCDGWRTEELPDINGDMREAIRFELTPLDDIDEIREHLEDSTDSKIGTNYTVYQAPIKLEGGPIRENYEKTVLSDVSRDRLEGVCDIPVEYERLRVWGNGSDVVAEPGDYLLFADRDGRYGGEYSLLARIDYATILDENTARKFSDAVGWDDPSDRIFQHVMFLNPIYEVDLDREEFWELLGFKGWPNDTYSPIDFAREKSNFFEVYDSVEEFVNVIKIDQKYPTNTRYYWLNTGLQEWHQEGGEMFSTAVNNRGAHRTNQDGFESASPGDKVLIYQMSPEKQVVGRGRVTKGLHVEYSEHIEQRVEGITIQWEESIDGPSWKTIESDPDLQNSDVVSSDNNYYLANLTEEEFNRILDLGDQTTFKDFESELEVKSEEITVDRGELYFPDAEWQRIRDRIQEALRDGNHVLLFGPPGTGKTKLARQVCVETVGEGSYELATASADWSTFDTVGGYQTTSENQLKFEPGVVLDRFHADNDGNPSNEWLIIDELNRADIDKAFGSLFSALSGESVTLPFDDPDGEPVEILDASREHEPVGRNKYYIPEDWRMLATINTLDKTSLYEMSYAFMRRWAFIPIGIPDLPEPEDDPVGDKSDLAQLVESYVEVWANDVDVDQSPTQYETVGRIWHAINQERAIGPAIIQDLYQYVAPASSTADADYVSPIIMFVFPQLEGLRRAELESLISQLEKIIDDDSAELWSVARDFFQMDLQPDSESEG